MKYIITESQFLILKESTIPLSILRRANEEILKHFISLGELNYPTLCDDFDDEYDYADSVIDYAIDEFLEEIDTNILDEDYYSDVMDFLRKLCRNIFGQYLIDIYKTTCSEKNDLIGEQSENSILNAAKKYLSSKLDEMEFRHLEDYEKDFVFSPKGAENPKYGIDGEWVKKSYHILIGYSLFSEVMSLFNLDEKQTKNLFFQVLSEKGFKPIKSIDSFDFSIVDRFINN